MLRKKTAIIGALGAAACIASALAFAPISKAATPSCGNTCENLYSEKFGPKFIGDDFKQSAKNGTAFILFARSNADPAEDFILTDEESVTDLEGAGLVSSAVAFHYGSDEGYQLQYAPYGVDSGQCEGVIAVHPQDGSPVGLVPCGASGATVWIWDSTDQSGNYAPLINGADTNFSDPYVLNYPGGAYPTGTPRAQLTTWTLSKYSGGTPFDNQMWSFHQGVEN